MSRGKLDKMVADEETHFLTLCRNAICALDTQKILSEIQDRKRAQTAKNKRDKEEFLGYVLPDLSELLPKVFESSVVQVCSLFYKFRILKKCLQEYYKKIWDHAASDKPITGPELSDITNFLLVTNLIQSPHRVQIWYD